MLVSCLFTALVRFAKTALVPESCHCYDVSWGKMGVFSGRTCCDEIIYVNPSMSYLNGAIKIPVHCVNFTSVHRSCSKWRHNAAALLHHHQVSVYSVHHVRACYALFDRPPSLRKPLMALSTQLARFGEGTQATSPSQLCQQIRLPFPEPGADYFKLQFRFDSVIDCIS